MGLIEKILFKYPIFNRYSNFDTEELTSLELAGRTTQKVNEVIDVANALDVKVTGKEDSTNITNNRKLSALGNFTGTLQGKSINAVFADIGNSLTLSNTIIDMINNHESIGTIYDGGTFLNLDPPVVTIEGGLF